MKQKTKTSAVVGAKVLIDWPVRWRDADPKYRSEAKARAEKEEHRFGKTGTIVSFTPNSETAKDYQILLDESGRIEDFYVGAFTVTEMPKPESEVVDLLKQILDAVRNQQPN